MYFAILVSLCSVVAAGDDPAVEVDAAARAYRIESYQGAREDLDRYRALRDRDDDLRTALSSSDESTIEGRRSDALAWYREATTAIHAGEELPAAPEWLEEGLAAAKTKADLKQASALTKRRSPAPTILPPKLSPVSKPGADAVAPVSADNPFGLDLSKAESGSVKPSEPTPFSFVNALIRAAHGDKSKSPPEAVEIEAAEIKDPVVVPAGPVVDGVDQGSVVDGVDQGSVVDAVDRGPAIELPSLVPDADATPEPKTDAVKKPVESKPESAKKKSKSPPVEKS